ncbi:Pentatricopeptide repeat-containing protein At2g31400, partial [Durusdinium trenchii]
MCASSFVDLGAAAAGRDAAEGGVLMCKSMVCFNAAMAACERAFAWTQALELFSQAFELKMANVVSFSTAVMAARSGSHGWQAALHLLQLSLQGGHANAFVFTAAIQACGLGSWRHALGVLEAMRGLSSVQVDSTALNACVTACERAEGWAQAVELFEAMESFQVSKEVISFNAAIAAWRGHWPQALRLMKELRSAALVPSVVTWNSCISAAEKASEWQMALQMLQELKDEGRPSVVSFNAVLSACERRGAWRWALQVLEDMPRSAVKPDAGSYGAVLTAVGREAVWWETALELLQQAWDSARDSSMSRKELLERAIVAVMRAGRLPEAVCLYREAQVLGLCAPSRGPDLLDLHDLALEAALAAVCERLLAGVDTGELVLITGRASHSREGSASMKEALVHFLDSELGLATGEVPGNPGRLHVSLPVEFQGPGRLQQRERKSQKKCGRHPSL